MSAAQTASVPSLSPTSLDDTEKYVPPHRRRQEEEERKKREAAAQRPDCSDHLSGGSPYRCAPGSTPPLRQVADRWKGLADDGWNTQSSAGSRWNQNQSGPRQTKTGTGWDVRDGRRWNAENSDEVFKKDKDKSVGINFDKYEATPAELTGSHSQDIEPVTSFRQTRGIHPLLMENIIKVEYEKPTPVQKYSIPTILSGRDLMACAQTGSGKTAAFLFPIITKMLNEGPPPDVKLGYRMRPSALPVALILSPTRELAIQTFEESRKYAFKTGIRTVVVYGGSEVRTQFQDLENGCDICVATPGRLADLMSRGKVLLKAIKYFVLDEADRMLDMGFSPQIYSIVTEHDMPSSTQGRQTVMFSATFPKPIQELAAEFLRDYIFLTVGRVGSTNEFIEQRLLYADEGSKPNKLLKLLGETKGLVLVFVETRKKADLIEAFLLDCRLKAATIHGDKSQSERERALHMFRCGEMPILVATDVAARGLDIHNIEHVINCDLPARIEDYVHRIGRTGRAGNRGKATSFVNEGNRGVLRELLSLLEESSQDVPDWFYQMVRQCTSAYRGGFNSGGGSGGAFVRRGNSRQAFSSRDMRHSPSSVRSTPQGTSRMASGAMDSLRSFPAERASAVQEDDDDGW